jgi:hypothetical protein
MNELLMQIISERAGRSGNPAIANLLARVRSSDPGVGVDIRELLAQQSSTNPMAAMIAKHLEDQRANASSRLNSPVIDVEPSEESSDSLDQAGEELREDAAVELAELRRQMEGTCAEVRLLRDRNDAFAAAVGACCICWGQKLDCRSCRGRGGPGFCMPDESLFEEFVLPAIEVLRAQKAKKRDTSPQVQSRSASAIA